MTKKDTTTQENVQEDSQVADNTQDNKNTIYTACGTKKKPLNIPAEYLANRKVLQMRTRKKKHQLKKLSERGLRTKRTKTQQEIKRWLPYHETILTLYAAGETIDNIAKEVRRSSDRILNITKTRTFKRKYDARYRISGKQLNKMVEEKATELLKHKIHLALNAEKETVQDAATTWLLERIPSLTTKQVTQQTQVNVYQNVQEDTDRIDKAADKLEALHKILQKGNPNVVVPEDSTVTLQPNIEYVVQDA